MRIIITLGLVALVTGCAYSHPGPAETTFQQSPTGGSLELRVTRHLDTVVSGPDVEEDQTLILNLQNVRINQRLEIPSVNVAPEFTATRFGPRSTGESYSGYVIVRKITRGQVDAYLHVNVVARTEPGAYKETAKFHGDFSFRRETDEIAPTP